MPSDKESSESFIYKLIGIPIRETQYPFLLDSIYNDGLVAIIGSHELKISGLRPSAVDGQSIRNKLGISLQHRVESIHKGFCIDIGADEAMVVLREDDEFISVGHGTIITKIAVRL